MVINLENLRGKCGSDAKKLLSGQMWIALKPKQGLEEAGWLTLGDLQSLHNLILKPGQTQSDILHILASRYSALYITLQKQLETHKKKLSILTSVMRQLIL